MMADGVNTKLAQPDHDIHQLLRRRWSPRAFSERAISPEVMASLLEAARWAPSCFNEQPWAFVVAHREDTEAFDRLLGCLVDANRAWARRAAVLMITAAKLTFDRNQKPNRHGFHDVGLAMGNLLVQATALGLAVHQMGGFDVAGAKDALGIPDGYEAVAAVAVGYAGPADLLDGSAREMETAPRTRRTVAEFAHAGVWGRPLPTR